MAKLEPHPLMRTIVDHPDADLPRLVYADWLDEQGDPKLTMLAEYIRIEIELANTPRDSEQFGNLSRRSQELKTLDRTALNPPMPKWVTKSPAVEISGRRGLPDYVLCRLKQFASGARVLEYAPITTLYLRDYCDPTADARYAAAALARKELIRVRVLSVSGPLDAGAFSALAANPNVSNLRKLELAGIPSLADDCAKTLAAAASHFTQLRELWVWADSLSDFASDALLNGFAGLALNQLYIHGANAPDPPTDDIR